MSAKSISDIVGNTLIITTIGENAERNTLKYDVNAAKHAATAKARIYANAERKSV